MKIKHKNPVVVTFACILVLAGAAMVIAGISMKMYGNHMTKKRITEFKNQMKDIGKSDKEINNTKTNDSSSTTSQKQTNENAIALINIPKISLTAPVCEGVDMDTLKYSIGHFKETPLPGKVGNCCLAGHRSYTYSELFNRLDEVSTGDLVIVQTKDKEYKYKIYDIKVVKPEDTWVLNNTKDSEITLITCTPIRVGTHRLVLKGKLQD